MAGQPVNLYAGMKDLAGDSFADGEMRGVFIPDDRGDTFKQPETERSIRALYSDGGRIESLADFSDEALAMYFDFKGGKINESGLAGDTGDPDQFEGDCREVLDSLPNVTPEVVRAVRQTAQMLYRKYRLAAILGEQRSKDQKKFREDKQEEDDKKHRQWREWQRAEKAKSPIFAALKSKQEQAKRLRKKYKITEAVGSIAKRLDPPPIPRKKK